MFAIERLETRQLLASAAASTIAGLQASSSGLTASSTQPSVLSASPAANATDVSRDAGVVLQLVLPNGGVNEATLFTSSVILYETALGQTSGKIISNKPQTSGGGDTILLQPSMPLKANTNYTFKLNPSNVSQTLWVKDISGAAFVSFTFSFTTGIDISADAPDINFSKTDLNTISGVPSKPYSAVTIGPDHKLYAATLEGEIYRWDLNADGTLANQFIINTVRDNNTDSNNTEGKRFITGITFDPNYGVDGMVMWVSHGQYTFGNSVAEYATDGTGKISRIYGTDFGTYQDVIVGIPRSVKDHLNNQIVFDPVKKNFYFCIPSQTAMGAADSTWGNRPESLMTAAILRVQLDRMNTWVGTKGAIDLQNYNIYNGKNPVRLYATGIRNAFDLAFTPDGKLYSAGNGSASGGNIPLTPTDLSTVPNQYRFDYNGTNPYTGPTYSSGAQKNIQTEDDYLYNIVEGGYYGHPNPTRGEYILNGGNPTAGSDPVEVRMYPQGTLPDRNYRTPAYLFNKDASADGMLVYQSTTSAFGSKLKGYILVTRYGSGDDILAIKPNANGTVSESNVITGITGFTGFENPLDLVEDPSNGNVYVVELRDVTALTGRITLLKPKAADAKFSSDTSRVSMYDTPGDTNYPTKHVTITNTGTTTLVIPRNQIKITGLDRKYFGVTNMPPAGTNINLLPGDSFVFNVIYVAKDTNIRRGNLAIPSNATNSTEGIFSIVQLRGFPQAVGLTPSSTMTTQGLTPSANNSPAITIKTNKLYFNAVRGEISSLRITIGNTGRGTLVLTPSDFDIVGPDADHYQIANFPSQGVSLARGQATSLSVQFTAGNSDDKQVKGATLRISSNDTVKPVFSISLRGLSTTGEGGTNEPSLQRLLDLYRLPIAVGDSDPEDVFLDTPPVGSTDEVLAQQFVKAGSGLVAVKPLWVFGNSSTPAIRSGYYTSGNPEDKTWMFKIPAAAAQAAYTFPYGTVTFDPGNSQFGFVSEFPNFLNTADGTVRDVFSEDALNTWESTVANRRKVRVYPLKGADGTVVANAYVLAFEEWTQAYDYQDVALLVTNVKIANAAPELSLTNKQLVPFSDRLVFNKVQTPDQYVGNVTRNTETIVLTNTGRSTMTVSSMNTSGPFSVTSGGGTNFTIAPGASRTVVVTFTATSGGLQSGTLTINSNDPGNTAKVVQLAGYWQQWSEKNPSNGASVEPTSQQILDILGYSTKVLYDGQTFKDNTKPEAMGDEVLSGYWRSADPSTPVRVLQLAAFHQQSDTTTHASIISRIQWYPKGSPTDADNTANRLFFHASGDGQSMLPRNLSNTASVAFNTFKTTSAFGFRVDRETWSDDALNTDSPTGGSHLMRFYPAYDRDGKVMPNTYIMINDYNTQFINYDFNDNIYLITNATPDNRPNQPDTVTAASVDTGVKLTWTPPSAGPATTGFNVYRSDSALGTYSKLTDSPLDSILLMTYTDTTAVSGTTYWYRITSLKSDGVESMPVSITATA